MKMQIRNPTWLMKRTYYFVGKTGHARFFLGSATIVFLFLLTIWIAASCLFSYSEMRDNNHYELEWELLNLTILDHFPRNDKLLGQMFTGDYTYKNCDLCTRKGPFRLLILVTTAPGNARQRNAIRHTWGSASLRSDVTVAFVTSVLDMASLQDELSLYDDLIVPCYEDDYTLLTLKTAYMFHWTSVCCPHVQYVVKTDDDMFINVKKLLSLIDILERKSYKYPGIYGDVHVLTGPERNVSYKYFVPEEDYEVGRKYPNYTSGPAYLLPASVTSSLFRAGLKFPYFKLEDVFFTGFVAGELGIPRIKVKGFVNEYNGTYHLRRCGYLDAFALMTRPDAPQEMFVMWAAYLYAMQQCVKVLNASKTTLPSQLITNFINKRP